MRRVEYFKWDYSHKDALGRMQPKKVKKGEANFHKFGCEYEEFESGTGNYSTAIIELDDGTVENIPVGLIRFLT